MNTLERNILAKSAIECLCESGYDLSHCGASLTFVYELGPSPLAQLLTPIQEHGVDCQRAGHVGIAVVHVDGRGGRAWLFRYERPVRCDLRGPASSLLLRGVDLDAEMMALQLDATRIDAEDETSGPAVRGPAGKRAMEPRCGAGNEEK